MAISTVSLSTVSEIAIVPESECSTPTLMVSWAAADTPNAAKAAAAIECTANVRRVDCM